MMTSEQTFVSPRSTCMVIDVIMIITVIVVVVIIVVIIVIIVIIITATLQCATQHIDYHNWQVRENE